jgi:LCP family protein required for cell wall assembly
MRARKRRSGCSQIAWGFLLLMIIPLVGLMALYFFAPLRTNVLVLGIDYAPPGSTVGRSDTIILMSINPLKPKVAMLSIPRDLWVFIPDIGENRINTAHFFAEAQQAGAGPHKTMDTIRQNFGVGVGYYLRVKFEGFRDVVDALGGVDIDLQAPMAGYPAGNNHLTGNKALAFARNRMGSDDFFRMQQGQIIIKSILRQMMNPIYWPRLPGAALAFLRSVDTNIPIWLWPRLTLALLRAGPDGINSRTIQREMVTPFTTDQGASVLLPDWSRINPLLMEMFGD